MKKIKWKLLIVALLGIVLASANRPPHFVNYHKYAWLRNDMEGTKYYVWLDVTYYAYTKGIDYDCVSPYVICTFQADPMKMHTDGTGSWFYISDVPPAGVDNSGTFELIYY